MFKFTGVPLIMDFRVDVNCTDGLLPADMTIENSIVRVLVIKDGLCKPLIASTVVMPQPEMQFFDVV